MLINIERTAFLEVNSLQKYKKLFFSTFKLSASTFGGGFVIIPLMRKKFVEKLGWIEEDEMMDLTAKSASTQFKSGEKQFFLFLQAIHF
jgi:chromate transporter